MQQDSIKYFFIKRKNESLQDSYCKDIELADKFNTVHVYTCSI